MFPHHDPDSVAYDADPKRDLFAIVMVVVILALAAGSLYCLSGM